MMQEKSKKALQRTVMVTVTIVTLFVMAGFSSNAFAGTIALGDCDDVNWELTTDGTLYIGTAGKDSTFIFRESRNIINYPWLEYADKIKKVEFRGTVYGNGGQSYMFADCSNLLEIDLSNFRTDKVTMISNMFDDCSSLQTLDLSHFNTSKMTRLSAVFQHCKSLESVKLPSLKTEPDNPVVISAMFSGCESLTQLDLSSFDTRGVYGLDWMFSGCTSLESVDLSNFDTSNVNGTSKMFYNCKNLKSVDLSSFDMSRVDRMQEMFYGCSNLTSLDLTNFVTSEAVDMSSMFEGCKKLKSLKIPHFDTSHVTNMDRMFVYCDSLTSLDLSQFDTSNATSMQSVVAGCDSLKKLNISSFDTSSVTDIDSCYVVYGCNNLREIALGPKTISKFGFDVTKWSRYSTLTGKSVSGPTLANISKYDGSSPGWYKIQKPLSKATLSNTVFSYIPEGRKPIVKVISNGEILKKGQDYTVTYKNNKAVGKAKAIIKGAGYYGGTITKTFTIKPDRVRITKTSSVKSNNGKTKFTLTLSRKYTSPTYYKVLVSRNAGCLTKFKSFTVKNSQLRNGKIIITTKLNKGEVFFVKVCAVKVKDGKKYIGNWSNIRQVKGR